MAKYQCLNCKTVYQKEIKVCPSCTGEVFHQQKIPYITRVSDIIGNKHRLRSLTASKTTLWVSIAVMVVIGIYTILYWESFLQDPLFTIAIVLINGFYIVRGIKQVKLSKKAQAIIQEYTNKYDEPLF